MEGEQKLLQAPKRLKQMEEELLAVRQKIDKEKEIIDELEKERRKKEKELEVDKEKIKKLEVRLYDVKTNKEYQALLKEIEAAKEANDRTEEDVLVLMDKVEDLKKGSRQFNCSSRRQLKRNPRPKGQSSKKK